VTLGEYLKQAASKPFAWAIHDCSTFAADWVVSQTGKDPMASIRGQYDDEETGLSLISSHAQGLYGLWADNMAGIWKEGQGDGAIGILNIAGQDYCGIMTGDKWAVLSVRGLRVSPFKAVVSWHG